MPNMRLEFESQRSIFLRTPGDISSCFYADKNRSFLFVCLFLVPWRHFRFSKRAADISTQVRGDQNWYFKPNHDVFLNLTKWFLCVNLSSDGTREAFWCLMCLGFGDNIKLTSKKTSIKKGCDQKKDPNNNNYCKRKTQSPWMRKNLITWEEIPPDLSVLERFL